MLLIKNGTIVDPYTKTNELLDILISDEGNILEIAKNIDKNCELFDATGLYISPGLVDVHVHFRTPGAEHKETVETGSSAALAGGYTTVVCMANTNPIIDDYDSLSNILEINKKSPINVLQCASITHGFDGKNITEFENLKKLGAVGFTDDGVYIKTSKTSFDAMKMAKELNVPLSFHEEDTALIFDAGINQGSEYCDYVDAEGATRESENVAVARDISLAITSGALVNFQHLSTKESVDLIKFGKSMGANIFAEVTPHHLALNEDELKICGTLAKMNPPLRKEEDRQYLIKGLKEGIIDIIATDHAPHTNEEKSRQFKNSPSGIIGLETAFSVCLTYLNEHLSLMEILEKMTVNPCKLYNLVGKSIETSNKCEVFIYNPTETVIYDEFYSKSTNTPFRSVPLKGKVKATIIGDKILYRG